MRCILLLGCEGQVGWELQRALQPLGRVLALKRADCDFSDGERLRAAVRHAEPSIIVNAAAYTAVDKAESDRDGATAVNALAPGILAEEARHLHAWLVHYSTDYVFDGAKEGAYVENDTPNPLNVYGATKLAGERAIVAAQCRHLIFRTSWVYAARGANFARTMLRLARERDSLNVIGDQFGAPTSAELIADVTALCLRGVLADRIGARGGIYHLAAAGETSWHGYAQHVIERAMAHGMTLRCTPSKVTRIASGDWPAAAPRPRNSRLDTTRLQQAFDVSLPDWRWHLERMLDETREPA